MVAGHRKGFLKEVGGLERQNEEGKCGRKISKSREAGMSMLGNGRVYTMVNSGV